MTMWSPTRSQGASAGWMVPSRWACPTRETVRPTFVHELPQQTMFLAIPWSHAFSNAAVHNGSV